MILFWLALGLLVSQKNNHENVVMLSTDSYDCQNFSPEVHYVHNGETFFMVAFQSQVIDKVSYF